MERSEQTGTAQSEQIGTAQGEQKHANNVVDRRKTVLGGAGILASAAVLAVAGGAGAAGAAEEASVTGGGGLERLKLINLSHVNDPAKTPIFEGDPAFTLETAANYDPDGYYLQYVKQGEHTGTHWGSPNHFKEGALSADRLDVNDLLLPAAKIDIRAKAAANADYGVTVADLQRWEQQHGPLPKQAAVIIWSGWDQKWGTPAYVNKGADGLPHQPGFTPAAAQWLLDRGVLGTRGALGSDTFGPDRGVDESYTVSTMLYDKHRISLESVANLAALPTKGAYVLPGGPLNKNGSGSPATIFGLVLR